MSLRIGVVGAGNVGSSLTIELARSTTIDEVQICSRTLEGAKAAVLDAISAFPSAVNRLRSVSRLENALDVVIVTAGVQHETSLNSQQLLQLNAELALKTVAHLECNETNFILVGSPVDQVCEQFSIARPDIDPRRIIGFGGELDRCRLVAALSARRIDAHCTVVGEHGGRTVPVYQGELDYERVTEDVRSVLSRIRAATGQARNLASGVQLARLAESLSHSHSDVHCVSSQEPETGMFLTWPHLLSHSGITQRIDVRLGDKARTELEHVLEQRRVASHV